MPKRKATGTSFVLTVVLFILAASSVSADSTKTLRIFLLGGQSNMLGADTAAKLKPPYNKPFPQIKIWVQETKLWETLSPQAEGRFGPEVSFGHAIAKCFPDEDIRLVKYAANGTALYNDWDPNTKGKQYVTFMNTTKAALAELDASKTKYEIAGMLWLQGESDAHENKAETYEKNLTEFIAHMRTQFNTPTMPFVIARVGNHYGGKTGQAKIVRDAQVKIAGTDKNVGWFDTDDCSMLNAGHYDAVGLIDIGKRFAVEYKKIVTKAPCTLAADNHPIIQAESLPNTTPWNLTELSKCPDFEWAEGENIRSLYYKSNPYKGKATRVFAYYATPGTLSGDPSKDKNLPAIVLVHGGGGTAFSKWAQLWASRGYAAIAIDLTGCGPNRKRLEDGGPEMNHDMMFATIDKPVTEQWTYHAVANVIRAHSLILSFPEVDSERSALTGISWGGYLTCIVAGIDNRFKAAVPVYGCGFLNENSGWLSEFAKMSAESREKWVQLWDPSQYVGSATMPMLFVNGGKDFCYPPDSYAKTYALVRSRKNIHFVPNLPHGHVFDRPKAIEVFIDQYLNQGTPLAKVGQLEREKDQISATVQSQTKLLTGELHYTLDVLPGDSQTRKWVTQPATIRKNKIVADLPSENITICFLTVTDERNTTVSSSLLFPLVKKP